MRKTLFIFMFVALSGLVSAQSETKVLDAFGAYENGMYVKAGQLFDDLILEKSTQITKYQYYKGLALYQQGKFDAARDELEKVNPDRYIEVNLWLAKIYALKTDPKKAISYLQQYLKATKVLDISGIKKDSAFYSLHSGNAWFMLWQEENLKSEIVDYNDAKLLLNRKQFSQARNVLDHQISKGITSADIFALNSEIYAEEGNQQLAIDQINRALSIDAQNTEYLKLKATYLERLDKTRDALEILNTVLQLSPEDFQTRYLRASLAFEVSQFELAKADLEILTKYFENPEYDFLSGKTDYELGNYVSALKTFNHIMEKEKPRAEYYKARGMTYYKTKIFNSAAYDLSMSLDISPDDPETNLYLGLAENSRGNSKMACYYLKRAKNYGSLEAGKYLEKYCQ